MRFARVLAKPALSRDRTWRSNIAGPKELVLGASVIATLTNPKYPGAKRQIEEVQETASSLGLKSILLSAGDDDELAAGFASAKQQGAGAMLVASDPFFNSRSGRFITLAAQYSIPTIYPQREYVRGGGLISYALILPTAIATAACMSAR